MCRRGEEGQFWVKFVWGHLWMPLTTYTIFLQARKMVVKLVWRHVICLNPGLSWSEWYPIHFSGPLHWILSSTVGIWILTIWIPETFEHATFWSSDFKWFGIQMVGLSVISYAQDSPTIWIPDKLMPSCFLMCWSGIQMAFENQTIWQPTSFPPFEYQTSLVFRFPLYFSKLTH